MQTIIIIQNENKKCPSCLAGKLKVRKGKFGKFLGCSKFPECSHTEQAITKTIEIKKYSELNDDLMKSMGKSIRNVVIETEYLRRSNFIN